MKLSTWIERNGGVPKTASVLRVSTHRIYMWLAGKATPQAVVMQRIVRASNGRVTYDEIINETKGTK